MLITEIDGSEVEFNNDNKAEFYCFYHIKKQN